MTLLETVLEDTTSSINNAFDDIIEILETIRKRCELDQYSKRDLQAEIDELLRKIV